MSKDHGELIAQAAVARARGLRLARSATLELQASVRDAIADGMTEVRAAELAGVSRLTIRSWLGKDKG